ncbi:MAG TPA: zf-HC2 domain-containing protein [Gemmatimonadales bacterium]|nr:zf-HC2 domain-containing protein [Gemmatimonadales bacterium]
MRHIPEDELHAYLDQALSRSQCVEIESHLASCIGCRRERDSIAALRDRTTALLATLAPPRRIAPSYELVSERAAARSARIAGRWRAGAWAASVLLAVGLGWGARSVGSADVITPEIAAEAPSASPAPAATTDSASAPAPQPAVSGEALAVRAAPASEVRPRRADVTPPPAVTPPAARFQVADRFPDAAEPTAPILAEPAGTMLSSGRLPSESFSGSTGALFRTVSWDRARVERGESVPRIEGLPVMEVQLAGSRGDDSRPLMVVAQQLESGQVIRTIEGPATDVNQLLSSQRSDASSPWPTMDEGDGIAGGDGAMAVRRGDRILAITAPLPSDSLRAMIRRLNASER